jgi:A/G-specific adenine glycosylase
MDRQSVPAAQRRRVQAALLAWHGEHALDAPWRDSRDPYQALVAAVMAQQTQMSRVMPAYERFVAAFPTLDALAAASRGDVIRVWVGMGYNQRAVRLHNAARAIAESGWPRDAAALALIEGIGPFTAAIIASFAFGAAAACVDTNVRRVLGRISGEEAIGGRGLRALADAWLVTGDAAWWNQALMDYGARVCTSRPKCGECVVSRWCASRARHSRATVTMAAEERVAYVVRPPRSKKAAERFEDSARYARGRIVDALRTVPPGDAIAVRALRASIPLPAGVDDDIFDSYIDALARAGLLVRRKRGCVSLPD